jgi:hypothetical protein
MDNGIFRYQPLLALDAPERSPLVREDALVASLLSGGDSRLRVDAGTGVNKYLCPPRPAPDVLCVSSCTASPITRQGFRRCADSWRSLAACPSERQRTLDQYTRDIGTRLLACFQAGGLAEAILCPSGTDALLTATMLLHLERPGRPMTAILPQASETGTGVPRAATLRRFDDPVPSDAPLVDCAVDAIAIPLREGNGLPRPDDEVADAYATAADGSTGRPIVFLTHGTKTGLIAPVRLPRGAEIIVDACQARVEPALIARWLRQGWPVAVTGSKFFGGPAFSGALLFPSERLATIRRASPRPCRAVLRGNAGNTGMLLRWIAALETMEAFAALGDQVAPRLRDRAAAIERGIASLDGLVPIQGMVGGGGGWSGVPSIFTVAVRDPANPRRRLTAAELRPLHARLARDGVLLGQPVELGAFGGLRIAIGARDLLPDAPADGGLPRLFMALREATHRSDTYRRAPADHYGTGA